MENITPPNQDLLQPPAHRLSEQRWSPPNPNFRRTDLVKGEPYIMDSSVNVPLDVGDFGFDGSVAMPEGSRLDMVGAFEVHGTHEDHRVGIVKETTKSGVESFFTAVPIAGKDGKLAAKTFELKKGVEFTIGADGEGLDFIDGDKLVGKPFTREEGISGKHLTIQVTHEGTIVFKDTSTNGTSVEGVKKQDEQTSHHIGGLAVVGTTSGLIDSVPKPKAEGESGDYEEAEAVIKSAEVEPWSLISAIKSKYEATGHDEFAAERFMAGFAGELWGNGDADRQALRQNLGSIVREFTGSDIQDVAKFIGVDARSYDSVVRYGEIPELKEAMYHVLKTLENHMAKHGRWWNEKLDSSNDLTRGSASQLAGVPERALAAAIRNNPNAKKRLAEVSTWFTK